MSRRRDRRHAFQLVFQLPFHSLDGTDAMEEQLTFFYEMLDDTENIDSVFVKEAFFGVALHQARIDDLINQYAEGWRIDRIAKTDLALLRLCVYELLFRPEVPCNVAINEALELAKIYCSDESPPFMNGVLGKITTILADRDDGS